MDLQPLVGTACAHCQNRILVDADGKNCARCGLALHRACAKAHREECKGTVSVARARRDYDEVAPVAWTPRLTAVLSVGAFLTALGLALVAVPLPEGVTASTTRTALSWLALCAGPLVALAGWLLVARPRAGR